MGISKERIKELFNLSKSTSTKGTEQEEGTGLGLALIDEFIKRCDGEIIVKSELGKGSEFTIRLPA